MSSDYGELTKQSAAIADYIDRLDWSREDQEKLLKMVFIDIGFPKNPRPLDTPQLVMKNDKRGDMDGN